MVSGSIVLLFLYQEESGEERAAGEQRPLPLAGELAEHDSTPQSLDKWPFRNHHVIPM